MTVSARFNTFLANLKLTDDQKSKGAERREAVVKTLNLNYYGSSSGTANSLYVGSWAKHTRIRPPRDVDLIFKLPQATYDRFQLRTGNKQSQLLQEVKGVIAKSYQSTAIRGDGPVVIVPFAAYNVEVIPAFALTDGRYWVCMTDGGGRYKTADYAAESTAIATSDTNGGGNTRPLARMMKCWQAYCSVPLKSFHIELVAIDFMSQWTYRTNGREFYDWMVRDFLEYLVGRSGTYVYAPGTYEAMPLGSGWKSKAESALARARKACEHETASKRADAGDEWQKIFGTDIPKYV